MTGLIVLLFGGMLAVSAMKKSPPSDGGREAIRALRRGDDVALKRAAAKWRAVGDEGTAGVLELLGERLVAMKKGTPQATAPTLDPDETKSPGLGELIARLGGLETRLMNLVGWAQAFGAESLPKTAAMLQAKAVNMQAAMNAAKSTPSLPPAPRSV